jgi:hypothetical protein
VSFCQCCVWCWACFCPDTTLLFDTWLTTKSRRTRQVNISN